MKISRGSLDTILARNGIRADVAVLRDLAFVKDQRQSESVCCECQECIVLRVAVELMVCGGVEGDFYCGCAYRCTVQLTNRGGVGSEVVLRKLQISGNMHATTTDERGRVEIAMLQLNASSFVGSVVSDFHRCSHNAGS